MDYMVKMGRPVELPQPWYDLAESVGGVDVLATSLGVGRRTIHRWATGEARPSLLARRAVNEFARKHGVRAPFATE